MGEWPRIFLRLCYSCGKLFTKGTAYSPTLLLITHTRAKALNSISERSRGFENPLPPGLKSGAGTNPLPRDLPPAVQSRGQVACAVVSGGIAVIRCGLRPVPPGIPATEFVSTTY
jgi:hypothetical protein